MPISKSDAESSGRKYTEASGWEYWRLTEDGLFAESKGHFDAEEFERQLASG